MAYFWGSTGLKYVYLHPVSPLGNRKNTLINFIKNFFFFEKKAKLVLKFAKWPKLVFENTFYW